MRERVERLACELQLSGNVRFVGHQTNIPEWLHTAKLFVLTSDSEGLSLALMEAMMCGLAAVVSGVGDLGDLVEDGVNGFLVKERSGEAFAARIVDLLASPERLRRFSQAARRSAKAHENSRVVERWDKILSFSEPSPSTERDQPFSTEHDEAATHCVPPQRGAE
jgi:glycosyltransferase involved in cell wall biosynthesis